MKEERHARQRIPRERRVHEVPALAEQIEAVIRIVEVRVAEGLPRGGHVQLGGLAAEGVEGQDALAGEVAEREGVQARKHDGGDGAPGEGPDVGRAECRPRSLNEDNWVSALDKCAKVLLVGCGSRWQ